MKLTSRKEFLLPPVLQKQDGDIRRVGYEIEFNGLSLQQTIQALSATFAGEVQQSTVAEASLNSTRWGRFKIELDSQLIKRMAEDYAQTQHPTEWFDLFAQAASWVVPMEVVCPPLPIDQQDALHPMIKNLREAGAAGTESSPLAAFGVHINPEPPDLEANTIHRYLQAFALLQWWLTGSHQPNPSRRLTPYIDPYPEAYLHELLSQQQVDYDSLFNSYLRHNATRNRGLDMLPLLAMIDEKRVQAAANDPRINPRPTFHYRLPNSHIENPNWSLADTWNHWYLVELLASQPRSIASLAEDCLTLWRPLLGFQREPWLEIINQWLKEQRLV